MQLIKILVRYSLVLSFFPAFASSKTPTFTFPKSVANFLPGEYGLAIVASGDHEETIAEHEEFIKNSHKCLGGDFFYNPKNGVLQLGSLLSLLVTGGSDEISYITQPDRFSEQDVKNKCVFLYNYSFNFADSDSHIDNME